MRIISGDTISVKHNRTGVERKLQLSSVRQPKYVKYNFIIIFSFQNNKTFKLFFIYNRPKDPKLPEYNFDAKELLRKKLIGKTVSNNITSIV